MSSVHPAMVLAPGGSDTRRARHQAMNAPAKEGRVDLVSIGDSFVGNRKWNGKAVWDHSDAKRNGMIPRISGTGRSIDRAGAIGLCFPK